MSIAAPVRQQTKTVENSVLLIVETDPTLRAQLQQWLEAHYTLAFADSGESAMEVIRRQSVDLAFFNLTLLEANEFDALRDLRAMGIPVILISALNDSAVLVQGLQLGANDYITRPLDADA